MTASMQTFVYSPAGDLIETHTFTNETAATVDYMGTVPVFPCLIWGQSPVFP